MIHLSVVLRLRVGLIRTKKKKPFRSFVPFVPCITCPDPSLGVPEIQWFWSQPPPLGGCRKASVSGRLEGLCGSAPSLGRAPLCRLLPGYPLGAVLDLKYCPGPFIDHTLSTHREGPISVSCPPGVWLQVVNTTGSKAGTWRKGVGTSPTFRDVERRQP